MNMLLNPGFELTLRPMKYPVFFEMYKNAIKNTWTVDEIDFSSDVIDLKTKLTSSENFLIKKACGFLRHRRHHCGKQSSSQFIQAY